MPQKTKTGRNDPCPCGSGKKFKKCCIDSETQGPLPPQLSTPLVRREEALISFERIARLIAKLPHHPLTVATSINKRLIETIDLFESTTRGLHVWQAGAMVLASFYQSDCTEYDAERLDVAEGEHADELLENAARIHGNRAHLGLRPPILTILEILCIQPSMFGLHVFQGFRTLYLLGLEDLTTSSESSPYDNLFQSRYGCSAREYAALLQALWYASTTEDGYFINPTKMLESSPVADRLTPVLAAIMKENSCKMADVRTRLDVDLSGHQVSSATQAFFASTPFIEYRPEHYLVGPHPYTRFLAMNGAFFRAIELARTEAASAGHRAPENNVLSVNMGRDRFEPLVRLIFDRFAGPDRIVGEHIYTKKEAQLSPDLIVFGGGARRTVALVQAKLKRLSYKAFYGCDAAAFERDARGAIAQSIYKSIRYLYRIHSVAWGHRLNAEGDAIARQIQEADGIILLGVFAAMPSLFHVGILRKFVEDGMKDELDHDEFSWYVANKDRILGWHVLDSEELAYFASYRENESFVDSLAEYLTLPEFGILLDDNDHMFESFARWFAEKSHRQGREPKWPEIDAAYQRFARWSVRLVFPGTPNSMFDT
jgi:hypothetical protein